LEARGGIEPPIQVLQTCALPLGYRASEPLALLAIAALHSTKQKTHQPEPLGGGSRINLIWSQAVIVLCQLLPCQRTPKRKPDNDKGRALLRQWRSISSTLCSQGIASLSTAQLQLVSPLSGRLDGEKSI
jgi:hypothetical protein